MNKFLGLILARGGSKRIPRKNIKEFLGKPLLAWSIEAAKESGIFEHLILSTDDPEIAEVGRRYGAEIPFMRPEELASDTALAHDVIRHALEWLKDNRNYTPEWVFLFEPTAPAKRPFHLKEVAEILSKNPSFDSLNGISEFPQQYNYTMQVKMDENNLITRAWDNALMKDMPKSSREIPLSYMPNPQIYAFRASNLFKGNGTLWGDSTYGYLMDSKYYIDIDTPNDWQAAEKKMKKILEENNRK